MLVPERPITHLWRIPPPSGVVNIDGRVGAIGVDSQVLSLLGLEVIQWGLMRCLTWAWFPDVHTWGCFGALVSGLCPVLAAAVAVVLPRGFGLVLAVIFLSGFCCD